MSIFKLLIIALLVAAIVALFRGFFFMSKSHQDSAQVLKSLKWRVGACVLLILLLVVGTLFGWIEPKSIGG